jgi:hypothetical protein
MVILKNVVVEQQARRPAMASRFHKNVNVRPENRQIAFKETRFYETYRTQRRMTTEKGQPDNCLLYNHHHLLAISAKSQTSDTISQKKPLLLHHFLRQKGLIQRLV